MDDKAEPSRCAQRQTEQRRSRAGGDAESHCKIDGEEKADLPGLDQRQTEQLAPRAREGRAAAQDSQAGAEGRRKADGEEKRQNEQSDPRVRAAAQDGPVRAEDHRKSGVDKTPSRPGPA